MVFPTGELIDTNQISSNVYIGLFVNDVFKMMKKNRKIFAEISSLP